MRRISSAAARRLDGLPIRRSRKPSGPSSRSRSRQRRNVRPETPSISAASACDSSPRSCRSSSPSKRICRTPCRTPARPIPRPPFGLKPDRSRATKPDASRLPPPLDRHRAAVSSTAITAPRKNSRGTLADAGYAGYAGFVYQVFHSLLMRLARETPTLKPA
jgi:hypothetical protein